MYLVYTLATLAFETTCPFEFLGYAKKKGWNALQGQATLDANVKNARQWLTNLGFFTVI